MASNPSDPVYQVQSGTYGDLKRSYPSGGGQYTVHHIPSAAATSRAILINLYNRGVDLGPQINGAFANFERTRNIEFLRDIGGDGHINSIPDPHIRQIFHSAYNNSPAIRIPNDVDRKLPTNTAANPFMRDMRDLWVAANRDMRDVSIELDRHFTANGAVRLDRDARKHIRRQIADLSGDLHYFQQSVNHSIDWVLAHPNTKRRPLATRNPNRNVQSDIEAPDQNVNDFVEGMMRRLARSLPVVGLGLSAHGLTETRDHLHRMQHQIDQLRDQATPQELAQMQSVIENYRLAASAQFGISIVPGVGAMAGDMGLNGVIQSLNSTFQQLHQKILQDPQALTEAAIRSAARHVVHEGRLPPNEFERVRNSIRQQYHSGNPDTREVVDRYKRFISDDIRAVGQNLAELQNIRSQQRISGLEVEDAPHAAMASLSAPTFSGRNGHHAFVASV